jgi:hypothetical protein
MELKITELNTMNPYDTFDYKTYEQNGENYWEKPRVEEKQTKKKKVSFNDILSNMNLVVNKQGVLQLMIPNQEEFKKQYDYNYNSNEFNEQPQYQEPQENKNSKPIDQSVKHSYIYNKYFKDYSDPNAQKPVPRVPKTIEEYNKMLLEDKIKAIEHRKMIEEVKSKKMMFTSAPGSSLNPRNLQASRNNLRMMNFR